MSVTRAEPGDEGNGEKSARWVEKHKTQAFSGRDKAMRYLIGMLANGIYLKTVKIFDLNDALRVHRATRAVNLPDVTERPERKSGRPKKRKKHHETEAERVRRLARDRQRKLRQKRQKQSKAKKKGKRK